jgi:hypothetical protein
MLTFDRPFGAIGAAKSHFDPAPLSFVTTAAR